MAELSCALEDSSAAALSSVTCFRVEGSVFRGLGLGFGFWVLGFGVWGLGAGVWGLEYRVLGLGFGVWGFGFGVWGLGFGVWGSGFGVWVLRLRVVQGVIGCSRDLLGVRLFQVLEGGFERTARVLPPPDLERVLRHHALHRFLQERHALHLLWGVAFGVWRLGCEFLLF